MAPLVVDPCAYLKPHHSVGHCPATAAQLPPTTIANLLDGRIWGDLPTIARIEGGLEVPLWVDQLPRRDDYRRS